MNEPHDNLVWGVSQFTDVPNIVVMGCLLALLIVLERRHRRMHIRLWILALGIVFFDQLVWFVPNGETTWRTLTHTTRLIGELLAGLTFLCYESTPAKQLSQRRRLVLASAPALIVLQVLYGVNVRSPMPYVLCAAVAVLIQVLLLARRRTPSWYTLSLPLAWIAVAFSASVGNFRGAAYYMVGYVFLSATRNFWIQLRHAYVGRAVVTVSLAIWAVSLFAHPWVMAHTQWRPLAEQTWAMQKFIVIFGMVVVLFEEQSREHQHLSQHDNLTGLANRRRLQQNLHAYIASGSASVLLLDLDGFKQVNDAYGHAAGDLVLQEVARRLLQLCGPEETVARVGGDEFIVASEKDLADRQHAFLETISAPVQLPNGVARVSGSVGLATYPADLPSRNESDAVSTLLNAADLRMYTAKHRHAAAPEMRHRA